VADCHHQHHQVDGRDTSRLIWAFGVISVIMVVEVVGGLMSGSLALLADATHMFADAFALGLAASAHFIARRPADDRRHFGYRRAQVLAAFCNGILLLFVLGWISVEAVQRFREPRPIDGGLMFGVALAGLAANAVAFGILHSANSKNLNVRGAMLHVIGDLMSSVAAVVAAALIMFTKITMFDPLLSLVVVGFIGYSAIRLLTETGHILLEGAPEEIDVATLRKQVIEATGVKDVHEIKIWQLTPEDARLTMHANIASSTDAEKALELIKAFLERKYGIRQSTVQIEVGEGCPDRAHHRHDEPVPLVESARPERRPHRHSHGDDAPAAALASHR
jgi:cobalt-zinc-cadmium efflux system protein